MLSIQKIGILGRTYRHLNRYRQILQILFKYGFGDLVDRLGIEQTIEIGLQKLSKKHRVRIEMSTAERLRKALEELGPTFIKLGQVLSTRPDLIPPAYLAELSKLQDRVPPFSFEEVREIIHSEMGQNPETLFKFFEESPFAAASIGQVHRARLESGEEVVVKVQRPGIRRIIDVDLEILLHLATLMEKHLEEFKLQRPTRIVREFARVLEKEIDYTVEAAHVERFALQFKEEDTLYVPRIYRDFTTGKVLTLEFVDGIKASETDRLRTEEYDLKVIAARGTEILMKQIFVYGFFHGDPHPGNILILPGNIICYLDFGMMGRISAQEQEDFADLAFHVVQKDGRKIAEGILNITRYEEDPDREALERDLVEIVEEYYHRSLKEIDLGKLLQRILDIVMKYGLSLKPNLYLMMKAIISMEGLGHRMDPDFEIIPHVEPFVRQVYLSRFRPGRITREVMDSGMDFFHLLKDFPDEFRTLIRQVRDGKLKVQYEHKGLNPMLSTLDRISNRVAFSIVLASLIIGSSLIILAGIPPKWQGIPVIGLAGFVVAGFMGFWLLVSILRRKGM